MKKNENAPAEVQRDVEDQQWKGFSIFLHVLLPIAGLALLWGQRGIFSKLLLQLDRSCVSVYCPSFSRREKLLKWASDRLPLTWSSQARTLSSGIPELWKDGSLLCTLINSVVPGACPNPHRHWRKPPLHAQALAYKYLGLVPMFTEDELSGDFTINQERNFIDYLQKLQDAINKWPTRDETSRKFSSQYVARGMGLYTAEQYRKTVFYVYANTTTKNRSNVLMYIRGPYGTQGKATISPFHNLKTIPVVNVLQEQLEATKTLPFMSEEQKSFLKTISLDFTSLVSNVEGSDEKNEIPIQIDMEIDRAKITYIPNETGIYEINLICDGEVLRGSPYMVQVMNNTSRKEDSFNTECENVDEKITFTKRKILSKVIDCIDEKICIDNEKVSRIKNKDSSESSTESENDDLTITAITKKKDEILKTEINCTLEDIIEEINSVQDKTVLDQTQSEKNEIKTPANALNEIKKIAEKLKTEVPNIVHVPVNSENNKSLMKVDSTHKLVKNCDEAQEEIVNLFQKDNFDEVDNKSEYIATKSSQIVSETQADANLIESTKYLKNIVNSTNRQEMLEKILPSDLIRKPKSDNNNNNSKTVPVKRIKSRIYFEITPKNIVKNNSLNFSDPTSPICPDHIDPEVECSSLHHLTLSEKRKNFSKQDSVNIPDSEITLSNSENDDSIKSNDYRELSVLNVLDSLKQSRKNSFTDCYALTSTTSLPNIASDYEDIDKNTFRERKDYWERLSSRSSSSVSLANSDYSHKKSTVQMKNYFNKQKSVETKKLDENIRKNISVDDTDSNIDTSLEDCTIIPLEQRKKLLLKQMYQQETQPPKKLSMKINFFKKSEKPKNQKENLKYFSPVSDRIQSFDANAKLTSTQGEKDKEKCKKSSTKHAIKTQFKKAINFFKNLEENTKTKRRNEEVNRRYSLDYQQKRQRRIRGGSLNLPHNLYDDVFGDKNGSFKGAPNKTGVVNSLSSFVQKENPQLREEDGISYNLFVNKAKSKQRKSVKSLFDVNY